jgi:mono/diheme cytochrome c family protein
MAKITDDTMLHAIKDGGGSVGLSSDMPAWNQGLSDDQIKGLVQYIRAFCKK